MKIIKINKKIKDKKIKRFRVKVSECTTNFFIYINYVIKQYMNKRKTTRSPGTKILEVPGINEIKIIEYSKNCYGLTGHTRNNFRTV